MRLDTVHLAHTGLPEGWTAEEAEAFFVDSAHFLVGAPDGAMRPRTLLPEEVESWIEVVRYAQRELWDGAESLGTTVALEAADSLWVFTRGSHRVAVTCPDDAADPHEVSRHDAKGRLWKLDPRVSWNVESRFENGKPIWSARWRPAIALVKPPRVERPVVAVPVVTVAETEPEHVVVADPESNPEAEPAAVAVAKPRRRAWYMRRLRLLRWRWRRDARLRRGVYVAAGVAVAALAVTRIPRAPMQETAQWIGDVASGRYRVWVTSVPPGTKLIVDGKDTHKLTPSWIVLAEGEHRVETSLGEYGTSLFSVKGGRGGRKTQKVSLLGRLALGCADSTITLTARMEGRNIGHLPASLDSVPAGRRQISFEGRDVTPWVEEVSVVAGQTTSFLAHPERVPDNGVVIARAYRVGQDGLKDLPGAVLYLDGKKACVTPDKITVSRGLHTAKLVSGNEASPVQLLRVEGGGELYATAEFGRSPEPSVSDQLVGAVSLATPPTVRATLQSQLPIQIKEMRISLRRWGREFSLVSMNLHDSAGGIMGDAVLPTTGMSPGQTMDYFVTIKSIDGEEFVSEMHTVKIVP